MKIEEGDLILFAADQWLNACEVLGKIRLYCADVLKGQGKLTIPAGRFDFLWIVDFPLLSFDKEQNRWYSSHHPFTAPMAEDIPLLTSLCFQNYRTPSSSILTASWMLHFLLKPARQMLAGNVAVEKLSFSC